MPIRISSIDESFDRWEELLSLILSAFAYMDGVIDPPSSAHRLTVEGLAHKAREEIGFVAMNGDTLVGCLFCRPEAECLYLGKLAVVPERHGGGIGRRMLAAAEDLAHDRNLPVLRLETRVELTDNHRTFARWGFVKTAENAHPGFSRPTSIEMQKRLALG
jgi:GNAT superfamily N-acetyltransferase